VSAYGAARAQVAVDGARRAAREVGDLAVDIAIEGACGAQEGEGAVHILVEDETPARPRCGRRD